METVMVLLSDIVFPHNPLSRVRERVRVRVFKRRPLTPALSPLRGVREFNS